MVYEVMLLFFKQIKKFIKWKLGKNPLVVCLIMLCFLYHHMKKKKKTYVSEVIFNGVIVLEHLILYWNSWMP
jgi:hypothetical protein